MINEIGIIDSIRANIEKKLVGKTNTIDLVLCALLCRGHVLIEDVPGTGKTTLASALALSLGCSFQRIQFTPDIIPSDIIGFTMADINSGNFRYHQGAIMKQVILADEINRTSPKTQSALLEVMQEHQVTVDGNTYALPDPFIVLATQNPVESIGTFPLPEAQLDRFFLRVSLGYPTPSEEFLILNRHDASLPAAAVEPVTNAAQILALQARTNSIIISTPLKAYICMLTAKTRNHPDIALGASPRSAIALMQAAKGRALLKGREYSTPDDIQAMLIPVLAHRLRRTPEAKLNNRSVESILDDILKATQLPDA